MIRRVPLLRAVAVLLVLAAATGCDKKPVSTKPARRTERQEEPWERPVRSVSEQPEGRRFYSLLKLSVFVITEKGGMKVLGPTPPPGGEPIVIPVGAIWGIRPRYRITPINCDELMAEAVKQSVQGISLAGMASGFVNLKPLKELKNLKYLNLNACSYVMDMHVAQLAGQTNLEYLYLSATDIHDRGLASLKALTRLRRLDLSLTGITSMGLAQFKDMGRLEFLNLSGTKTYDWGLARLALPSLEQLVLDETNISDRALAHLKKLTQLKSLSLRNCRRITAAGVEDLQAALPELKITR